MLSIEFLFSLARPLLTFKRNLSQPTSEARLSHVHEAVPLSHTHQEPSLPLNMIDIDTSNSFISILHKVRNSLSQSTKRRISDNLTNDEINISLKENQNLSLNSCTKKNTRKNDFHEHKNVSFAESVDNDNDNDNDNDIEIDNPYSIDDQREIVRNAHALADQILMDCVDGIAAHTITKNKSLNTNDNDLEEDCHQKVRSRRVSISNNAEDLIYQDLSAEIADYILKYALRILKQEQKEVVTSKQNEIIINQNEHSTDFIDLK